MVKDVVVVDSPGGSYVHPPILAVTSGDTVVFHAVGKQPRVTLNLSAELFEGVGTTLTFDGRTKPLTVARREQGEYDYTAQFQQSHIFATGGSFPKVIIY